MSVTSSTVVQNKCFELKNHEGLHQLQNLFVTNKDLRGQNALHVNYCPATCLLKNQSLPLAAGGVCERRMQAVCNICSMVGRSIANISDPR